MFGRHIDGRALAHHDADGGADGRAQGEKHHKSVLDQRRRPISVAAYRATGLTGNITPKG
ncbi:hypothetical protein NCCNTM_23240 [Mycolicibacterium sp. NCC-Tsukiji]|nr:hypothetical protein NCCNTM_23240 [Mycolicibacterium sp. NCC-Tsukiji]